MADCYSCKRVKSADCSRHKKAVYKIESVRLCSANDLADTIQRIVGSSVTVNRDDSLCSNCVSFYKNGILEIGTHVTKEELPPSDDPFLASDEIIDVLNNSINTLDVDMSPFKSPSEVRPDRRLGYLKRKKLQMGETLSTAALNRLEDVYGVSVSSKPPPENPDCCTCNEWFSNIHIALQTSNYDEKVQLLTLLPQTFSKTQLMGKLQSAVSKYIIDKSRNLRKEKGIYSKPDHYSGHPLSTETLTIALSYYLEDSKDCTRESPNKKDVISVKDENGEKVKKAKRFMTRSIKEAYGIMKTENPGIKIGLSKFYSLCPKWVKLQPIQAVCTCIYCSNLKLLCVALQNSTSTKYVEEALLLKCLCNKTNNEECWLQMCGDCIGTEALTAETLNLNEVEEVTYAIWERDDLIKKTVSVVKFLEDIRHWIKKAIPHNYIRNIQRKRIAEAKSSAHISSVLVFHFDFAENWSIILPDEIQNYHWQNIQISLFTCVAYIGQVKQSFAIVSDDTNHDTAHSLCAIDLIKSEMSKTYPLETMTTVVYISDGAAAHFKNRYQLYELSKGSPIVKRKWIFSATGHGKSACDGVGGVCKHYATRFNLQKESVEAIRDAASFVSALSNVICNIKILLLKSETVEMFRSCKEKEWTAVKPVVGIQSQHYWLVQNNEAFMARTINHQLQKVETTSKMKKQYSVSDFKEGDFVGCVYDDNWWIGQIISISRELEDITVSFMHPHGPHKGFQWPEESRRKKDICPVPLKNVLLKVKHPIPLGQSARLHTFDEREMSHIQQIYSV